MHDQQTSGLIRAAQGGDAAGFAELVDRYYDTIYRFAWKWCGNRADAQDIAQLACVKLAASVAQVRFLRQAQRALGPDSNGYRAEFVQLVRKARDIAASTGAPQ